MQHQHEGNVNTPAGPRMLERIPTGLRVQQIVKRLHDGGWQRTDGFNLTAFSHVQLAVQGRKPVQSLLDASQAIVRNPAPGQPGQHISHKPEASVPAQLVGSGGSRPVPDRDKPRFKNVGQRAVIDVSKSIVETV
ncbi:hypothetical protein R69749_06298 [Paraburkholderia domus]|nr:hypothetical protein R69749_06298 [Paraburkholderia domus]